MDIRYMRLALTLAARGLGRCWPNPAVGCVLVRDGRIVGRGFTQPGGRPHAERVALAQAGDLARGATAYVTLEPCSHHGKTPPCAEGLIEAGVARVISALEDSDPRVAGRGHAMLRAAGIEVVTGVLAEEARAANLGFLLRVEQNRPLVTLKLASSFDGRIATATGESQWITGPEARRLVHAERAIHDAVLVGGGTARADDPGLTVRGLGVAHQPVRIVASRRLDLPQDGQLARTAREVPVWLLHGRDAAVADVQAWQSLGAETIEVEVAPNRELSVPALLQALAERGLTRVFCEGGGAFAASLLNAGLVDRLVGFTAGVALGAEGRPSLGAMGVERLAEAPRFALQESRAVGGDVMHVWHRVDKAD
ncbi:bifunctional diaminohydroxyphosphoribosylaminopyrimidine deaminase/5-amino-6-(5-phosphoribosylamino)uracil reductase RibD [Pseudoruegeria sp. SHC-113]|uniref:bifunctional diaminohydroxyphosphoribosylaminopyrimidine deaminase/5-amino-6-(5-phosphoribosylamino)uracil reductase RibD n=1 Tax=Pseudoruegeria sp. SHC-113 TaxID=2855439 RepID=UPI0021BA9208|nr:bifunctional diaminohydroxyphosphoribosylaminopyrimidine deaminase/5-amino-6-(5-phosphoribosylamino)uracil reductase RibD [Pseudoruegeria sp. SHC-113]MCT8159336.1 bifunctional diaminohydroxyphosphoribosylaminopyrimidine deaminase/5-amino-6-(5-phosphoribosylamino)uracil reductase RibD [Pseudoruegeria sp. SHC-113]